MFLSPGPARALPFAWIAVATILLTGCPKKPQTWTPAPAYVPATGKDFDLTWSNTDANHSPEDPEWAPQQQAPANVPPVKNSPCDQSSKQPYDAQCSDQSGKLVQDTGRGLTGLACNLFGDSSSINGHVDWTVASVHGSLGFLNFADDWDYNLLLLPDSDAGLTGNNNVLPNGSQKYIEVEFDSRELEDRFRTQWWRDFASLARAGAQAGDFTAVDGHLHSGSGYAYGSIYGLFGLDCEHGCRSEFHPAYAVAVQVDESKDSNLWAIFARNSGDQGFCSHLDHRLDLGGQAMQVLLPYKSSKPPSAIAIKESATSAAPETPGQWCPRFTFSADQGEVVEIPLPPPDAEGLTEVVVQFSWPDGAAPMPSKSVDRTMLSRMMATERSARLNGHTGEGSAEERMGQLYRSFTSQNKGLPALEFRPKVLADFVNARPAAKLTTQSSPYGKPNNPLACEVPETAKLTAKATEAPAPPAPLPGKRAALPTHSEKDAWDKATIASLCSAYEKSGKKLPDGEPPQTAQKLEKLCSDKRLKK
jgi:hypothetical protein